MRKIKFRARSLEDYKHSDFTLKKGDWLYFSIHQISVYERINENNILYSSVGNVFWDDDGFHIQGFKCDFETLGQWTGLKDRNNIEIFEGDIVKHSCGAYGVITWIANRMQFGFTQGWCHPVYGNPPPTESEIIGNIYENPELLEKEEK